jgi:hypothetical protein
LLLTYYLWEIANNKTLVCEKLSASWYFFSRISILQNIVWFGEVFSGLDRKDHCHLVGYQPINFRSQIGQKEAHIRQSAGHLTNSRNEILADPQDICVAAEHQQIVNLDQPNEGLRATGKHCSTHEQGVSNWYYLQKAVFV